MTESLHGAGTSKGREGLEIRCRQLLICVAQAGCSTKADSFTKAFKHCISLSHKPRVKQHSSIKDKTMIEIDDMIYEI